MHGDLRALCTRRRVLELNAYYGPVLFRSKSGPRVGIYKNNSTLLTYTFEPTYSRLRPSRIYTLAIRSKYRVVSECHLLQICLYLLDPLLACV